MAKPKLYVRGWWHLVTVGQSRLWHLAEDPSPSTTGEPHRTFCGRWGGAVKAVQQPVRRQDGQPPHEILGLLCWNCHYAWRQQHRD